MDRTKEVLSENERSRIRGEITQDLRTVADGLDGSGHPSLNAGEESVDLAIPESDVRGESRTRDGNRRNGTQRGVRT